MLCSASVSLNIFALIRVVFGIFELKSVAYCICWSFLPTKLLNNFPLYEEEMDGKYKEIH